MTEHSAGDITTLPGKSDRGSLRKHFYAVRARESADEERQQTLRDALRDWLLGEEFHIVGLYMPFRGEPDIVAAVLDAVRERGGAAALPVIDDLKCGLMHYALWSGAAEELSPGKYGILEPLSGVSCEPDVILSPCVAVSCSGFRLGNGGGFFDRYLRAVRQAGGRPRAVAVAYVALMSESVQGESHDEPFDWIATEAGVRPVQAVK